MWFADGRQRVRYLTKTSPVERLTEQPAWDAFFTPYIDRQAAAAPREG